jgi:transcriptional regulator with XRE-family HTH domain
MAARIKQEQRRDAEIVGRLLREFRDRAGLTQAALAARLGRPQQYVSAYESGGHRMDLYELRAVCDAVGAALGEVVRRYERRVPRANRS